MHPQQEDMGLFEIAVGTQWDSGEEFEHEMFPDRSTWSRFEERAARRYPQSVREHLGCPIVPELTPTTQKHDIEGLVMGAPESRPEPTSARDSVAA